MKTIKYIISTLILVAMVSVSPAEAVKSQTVISDTSIVKTTLDAKLADRLERSLLHGLSSDVYGIIESSLFNVVEFKIAYPEFSSERVERQISKIVSEGSSHSLRYKAYLTLTYMRNQSDFNSPETLAEMLDSNDRNKIFYFLQSEIQDETVTVSN
jgi:hypothetical protein